MSDGSGYHVQHRRSEAGDRWTTATSTLTGTAYTVTDLRCNATHDFRVGAYGDSVTYNARTGLWAQATTTTDTCSPRPPEFESESYGFDVSVAARAGEFVGTVTAFDLNDDPIAYSITAGNAAGTFAIASSTGEITVAGGPGAAVGAAYTLTVGASDGVSGTTSAMVTVTVVEVDCGMGTAVANPGSNLELVSDCETLLGLRNLLSGTATLNWRVDTPITSWDGVTVGGTPRRVTRLVLERRGLTGEIPSELGLLTGLEELNVSLSSQLTGLIPAELGDLANLRTLQLHYNRLTGPIPPELGGLSKLTDLQLHGNALNGPIPPELGNLSELVNLYLGVNYLTGPIPVELSRLAQLEDLWLSLNRLSGPIPPELGMLQALRNLELDENRLSGGVPWELGSISSLSTLRLSENFLEGCIRSSLRNVQTNDLDRLGLADCPQTGRVPAPLGLGVSLASSTFTVTWGAVSGAANYEVQERTDGPGGEWTRVGATTATTLTYSLSGGPECGATFEFRVRSFGDATTYAAGWSEGSGVQSVVTASCNRASEFATSTYMFTVAENATTTDPVGTVFATDPDSDPVSHAITSGNAGGRFAIATSTGDITVAGALDHEGVPSYTLVVEARDDRDGVATTTVEIEVTDVAEDAPPAPTGLGVTLADGQFTATWSAVAGASVYEQQQQVPGSGDGWAAVATTAGLTQTYSPAGGPACGTTYEFRVRAYGDGTVYAAVWGAPSGPADHTTSACNRASEFATSTYMFTVAENATTTDPVGTVFATDPDSDPVSHAITSGNAGGRFAIATSTGDITVAGALDHEGVPSYTLVVEARDDRDGVATTTVEIEVTDVAEDAPPAPTGLGVTLADGQFTATWSAVAGASVYEQQQQVPGSGDGWAAVATTAGLTQTYSPAGGPACGTTYEFRVRAYGDGATYAAVWGQPSQPADHTTGACNRAPMFGASSYTLTISENAATGTSVGAVSATDPDGDPVSHSIIVGNGAGKFTISTSTGAITLTGTVDPDAVAFYALTVEASDDEGETSTASVGVAVLLDECSNGTVVPRPRSNPRLVRDCSMLLASRDTLAGDASLDWSADTDIDDWQGVRVERGDSPYVRVLFLPDAGLTGSIPAALGGLADLRRVDLDYNSLTGGLPRELGSLAGVELMYLNHNNLTGAIPAELGQLRNLNSLFLTSNNLTGGIPPELGNLRSLTELIIEENSLTGVIPVELGALSNLKSLYLSENNLSGGIPPELGNLSNLKYLLLEGNPLGGEIPSELGGLTRLENVYLRHNGLTGQIPAAWGDLPNLTSLYLNGNSLTGCIPSGLRDVEESDLEGLGLDYCS